MGEFSSGGWIIGLGIYFFVFFLVVFSIVSAQSDMGQSQSLTFDDPGFRTQGGQYDSNYSGHEFNGSVDGNQDFTTSATSFSSIKATLAVMSGISSDKVDLGMPAPFRFIMVFFLFWVPLTMLLWAIYMAVPMIH